YWDPASPGNWVMLYYNENGFASTDAGVLDPARRRIWVDDLNNSRLVYLDLEPNGDPRHVVSPPPTGDTAWLTMGAVGMVFDPNTHKLVIWGGGDTVYVYDPTTNVSTAVTYPGGPGPAQPNGTYGRWTYSPAMGVFVLINSIDQNAFTFRLP